MSTKTCILTILLKLRIRIEQSTCSKTKSKCLKKKSKRWDTSLVSWSKNMMKVPKRCKRQIRKLKSINRISKEKSSIFSKMKIWSEKNSKRSNSCWIISLKNERVQNWKKMNWWILKSQFLSYSLNNKHPQRRIFPSKHLSHRNLLKNSSQKNNNIDKR